MAVISREFVSSELRPIYPRPLSPIVPRGPWASIILLTGQPHALLVKTFTILRKINRPAGLAYSSKFPNCVKQEKRNLSGLGLGFPSSGYQAD
jgi:hypothetical protein